MSSRLARRFPPVLVWLVVGALMALCARLVPSAPLPLSNTTGVVLIGASTALGVTFAVAAVVQFGRAQTTVDPRMPDNASALVTSGVFRFTRNPMYLGLSLLLAAWALKLNHPVALAGPPLFVLWIDRMQIPFEERAMSARFGEAFDRYCRTTRRWI